MAIGKLPDAGDAGDEGESLFAEINITPLTDVFLVMVVIFMVSALAEVDQSRRQQKQLAQTQHQTEKNKHSGLRVNLPKGKAQEIDLSKHSLVLVVPIHGDVEVGNKQIPDKQLDRMFHNAFTEDKATQVIIRADRAVINGRIVNLMERAKEAGLTRLAIATSGGA